jgi:hypothetical protein
MDFFIFAGMKPPVNSPEFDETLDGHSAVARSESIHAVVSVHNDDGSSDSVVLCSGESINWREEQPRIQFEDEDADMCDECWPETVLK